MSPVSLQQRIEKLLMQSLLAQDSQVKVQVRRNSFGWLRLSVITRFFENKQPDERKAQVNTIIASLDLNVDEYPFSNYQLLTPQQFEEQARISPVQIPLWSEILLAPDPEVEFVADEEEDAKKQKDEPFIATFYSFKGGVGRSTALAFVANILATQGYRVAMIDFDLEAPGLSFVHPVDGITCGALDYIYQRDITPTENEPKIEDCIRQINIPARGELYLIPAGAYDENYIHRLADLNIHAFYQREKNPIHQLLEDVKQSLKPHVILIDARTGFTEMGAIALFDQTDLGIICFSPTRQSYAGLEWVVKAANKQRKYNGIPDLRFLLTPMPPVAQVQEREWLGQAADWITEYWEVPPDITVDELYYRVPYNGSITTLDSLFEDVPTAVLDSYFPIADVISASLPKGTLNPLNSPEIKISDQQRRDILEQLNFQSPNAQDIAAADIPALFQRTSDFPKFLQNRNWLIRGAKGTGKTLLFRLFVEQSQKAQELASLYENLAHVGFVPGHGKESLRSTFLTREGFGMYEREAGSENWMPFWLNYLLLQLAASLPDVHALPLDSFLLDIANKQKKSREQIVGWLTKRIAASVRALDELQLIDEWLGQRGQRVWVLYDELDTGFGQRERQRNALEALLEWWLSSGSGLSNISPKILLREDLWNGLNFNNKTHYSSRTILLRWDEENLWCLVLRQALGSNLFKDIVRQQSAIEITHLDAGLQLATLREALFPLWGERMGRTKKSFTYNWVQKRVSDYKNNRFPRSLILLLYHATEIEKGIYDRNPYDTVLRPSSLINALPKVSEERVNDVKNEYSDLDEYLNLFATERSPIGVKRLEEIWKVDTSKLKELITDMIAAGILKEYPPRLSLPDGDIRYSVAELYLTGLKMTRLGQR